MNPWVCSLCVSEAAGIAVAIALVLVCIAWGYTYLRWRKAHHSQFALLGDLERRNDEFLSIFESGATAIGVTDIKGNAIRVNQRWQELFGYEARQLGDAMHLIHPVDQVEANRMKERLLSGKINEYTALRRFVCEDGSNFFGELYVRSMRDKHGNIIGSTSVVIDVSDRKKMEASLIQRDRMLTGLADALARLLEYHTNLGSAMTEALASIGWAADVDRAYIFEEHDVIDKADSVISMRYEWCAHNVSAQLSNPLNQCLPWDSFLVRWREMLYLNQEVAVLTEDLTDSELSVIEGQDIKSLLLVPVFIEDRMWGFVGFDDCREPRRWSEMEISILRAAAKGFGIALQRQRAESSLILAKERAELLNQKLSEENLRTTELAKTARLANKTKSRFLANMSHEIRTPMNGVLGMCTVLGGTPLSDEQAEYLAIIRKSADGLLGIIEDILDFSKIEAGKLELDYNEIPIVDLVEDVLDLFALNAQEKSLTILHQIAPDVPAKVLIDGLRLRQILVNLVSNAIKFTESGYVALRVWQLPSAMGKLSLYFEVEDSGPGIHPDMRSQLFEAFNQLNSSTARKFGGTGLGLSISQKLAQMMGGDLRLMKSDSSGATFRCFVQTEAASDPWSNVADLAKGSTPRSILFVDPNPTSREFHLNRFLGLGSNITAVASLDEAKVPAQSAQVVILNYPGQLTPEGSDVIDLGPPPQPPYEAIILASLGESRHWQWRGVSDVNYRMKPLRSYSILRQISPQSEISAPRRIESGRSAPPPGSIARDLKNRVIWIVDDNSVNLRVASLLLKRLGLASTTFSSGNDALGAIADNPPDIVFMDLQMPGLDGFETTSALLHSLPACYVIAMTSAATIDDREACKAAGMRDFVPKPVKESQLIQAFSSFLAHHS